MEEVLSRDDQTYVTGRDATLVDRDGEWLIGAQGGYQAPGMDNLPDMTTAGWVESNGHYGHGCACMDVTVDRRTRRRRCAGSWWFRSWSTLRS